MLYSQAAKLVEKAMTFERAGHSLKLDSNTKKTNPVIYTVAGDLMLAANQIEAAQALYANAYLGLKARLLESTISGVLPQSIKSHEILFKAIRKKPQISSVPDSELEEIAARYSQETLNQYVKSAIKHHKL